MNKKSKPDNLVEILQNSVSVNSHRPWLGSKNIETGEYDWVTYGEMGRRIDNMRAGLAQIGVGKGDTVAVLTNNSVEWAVLCYATYGCGARFVPMYAAELPQIWKYIIKDSGTKALFVADDEIYNEVSSWPEEIDVLQGVYRIYGDGEDGMAHLEKKGAENPVDPHYPDKDDIAGLIYTSGTTGDPKGVMLSHENLTSNVHDLTEGMHMLNNSYRSLAIIPWAHGYGQTVELHTLMRIGGSCGFAEAPTTVVDDLQKVKPSILFAVPRVYSRVYDGVVAKMNNDGGLAKSLFDMGLKSAEKKRNGSGGLWNNIKYKVADKIVFSKIRGKFGGNLEFSFSSGSKLNAKIGDFFHDIGVPVFEAWGMTELAPTGSCNYPYAYKIGSAGRPSVR